MQSRTLTYMVQIAHHFLIIIYAASNNGGMEIFMKKALIMVLIFTLSLSIFGCANKKNTSVVFQPYQKMIQLEKNLDSPNPNWSREIKNQLIDKYGLSEGTSDRLIREGKFERYRFEYATNQEYENQLYPYCLKADFFIWKSNSFYSICDICDKKTESVENTVIIITEGPDEPWVEKSFKLLSVMPVNQAAEITMGSQISFSKEGANKVGPFTLVQTFYISCPWN